MASANEAPTVATPEAETWIFAGEVLSDVTDTKIEYVFTSLQAIVSERPRVRGAPCT